MSDPLRSTDLLARLPGLLPASTSSPLVHPADAIAALVHAIHTALQFRLVTAGGQADPRPATQASSSGPNDVDDADDAASETATAVDPQEEDDQTAGENRLPDGWNSRGEDSYSFEYRHEQSAMVFRVRVGRMGGRVQIDAMAEVRLERPSERVLG